MMVLMCWLSLHTDLPHLNWVNALEKTAFYYFSVIMVTAIGAFACLCLHCVQIHMLTTVCFDAHLQRCCMLCILQAPFYALCWVLDVVYDNKPIQKFWVLETVARIPYFACEYVS